MRIYQIIVFFVFKQLYMRGAIIILFLLFTIITQAQVSRDTVLRNCPVFITDTVSVNNFFIEGLPATLRVFRVRGKLTVKVEQRDQSFTLFFHGNKLKSKVYEIDEGSKSRKEVEAAYTFKSGDQVSYIGVSNGRLEVSYDKSREMWRLVTSGLIRNRVERSVTYYRVKADFYIK